MFRDLLERELQRDGQYQIVGCGAEDVALQCERLKVRLLVCNPMAAQRECADLIHEVRRRSPGLRVLLVAQGERIAWAALVSAVQAGADGCVITSEPLEQLLLAAKVVASGGRCFSPETQLILKDQSICAVGRLTQRQCEVLRLIAEGLSTKEISSRLRVSVKTADHHRSRVMKRLNLHDAVSTARFAFRMGLAAP